MKNNGNLSVRSAKEELEAIHGAKDFLRGSQEEEPHKYAYYQKQINNLNREESELNSWLKSNGGFGSGGSIWDDDYDEWDAGAWEEIPHINNDLHEGLKTKSKSWDDEPTLDWGREHNKPEAPKAVPIGTYKPDERGFGKQHVPFPLIIGKGGDKPKIRNLILSPDDDTDDNDWIPAYDSEGNLLNPIFRQENEKPNLRLLPDNYPLPGRIEAEPDGGDSGIWFAPDGSGTSIDDFPVIDNDAGSDKVDSKTAWGIISDWVNSNDGDVNNGSFQTDPETGKTYYVSPDGILTPVTAFGVEESDVPSASSEDTENSASGDTYTVNPSVTQYDSENTYTIDPSAELIGVDGSEASSDDGLDGLSADTPHSEENKAKYNDIYEVNLREISALEAHKQMLALGTDGANITTPDIDKRLSELYNQNERIDTWRNAEMASDEDGDNGENAANPDNTPNPKEDSSQNQTQESVKDVPSVQAAFQKVPNCGDYDGTGELYCVDLTRWYIDTYTTLKSTRGDGFQLAANTAEANNLPAPSSIPKAPAVFSVAPGKAAFGSSGRNPAGHTGIVLSVDEANHTVSVIHTRNDLTGAAHNSEISTYPYPADGVTFTYLGDHLKK